MQNTKNKLFCFPRIRKPIEILSYFDQILVYDFNLSQKFCSNKKGIDKLNKEGHIKQIDKNITSKYFENIFTDINGICKYLDEYKSKRKPTHKKLLSKGSTFFKDSLEGNNFNKVKLYCQVYENFISYITPKNKNVIISPHEIRLDFANRLNILYRFDTLPCHHTILEVDVPQICENNDLITIIKFQRETKILQVLKTLFNKIQLPDNNKSKLENEIILFTNYLIKELKTRKIRTNKLEMSKLICWKTVPENINNISYEKLQNESKTFKFERKKGKTISLLKNELGKERVTLYKKHDSLN